MGRKTLIPEEKWEGLRHALEEAAGTRRTSKIPGPVPEVAGEVPRTERGRKRGAGEEGKQESKRETGKKGKKKEKKEKKKKKGKKRKKKVKKGKGKKKKSGKRKGKG